MAIVLPNTVDAYVSRNTRIRMVLIDWYAWKIMMTLPTQTDQVFIEIKCILELLYLKYDRDYCLYSDLIGFYCSVNFILYRRNRFMVEETELINLIIIPIKVIPVLLFESDNFILLFFLGKIIITPKLFEKKCFFNR